MLHRVVKHSEDYMLNKVDTLVSSDFFISKQGNAHGVDSLQKKQNVSLYGYLHGCSSKTSTPDRAILARVRPPLPTIPQPHGHRRP
jgi:beta-arabinofuranosyltransferase